MFVLASGPRPALLREAPGRPPPLIRPIRLTGQPGRPRRRRSIVGPLIGGTVVVGLLLAAVEMGSSESPMASIPLSPAGAPPAPTPIPSSVTLSALPLDFVANEGQWDADTEFMASKGATAASFQGDGVDLAMGATSLRLNFDNARSAPDIVGETRTAGSYNFVLGNDPGTWRDQVAAYTSIRYDDLYDGIDVRFRELVSDLEYDVLLEPHADLNQFVVRPEGVDSISIEADGSLEFDTNAGPLRQTPPVAWNVLPNGEHQPVTSAFRLIDHDRYGLSVTGNDPALPLVIDPGIEWSTFVGGSGDEALGGMAAVNDGSGDIIIGGWSRSPEFPATGGLRASGSTFVARVSGTGDSLVYATYFGGSRTHSVSDVAVDADGNPLVVGDTNSKDFPVTPGAFDSTPPGNPSSPLDFGDYDGYVLRLNSSGGGPLMASYLAGDPATGVDNVTRAGYDPAGNPVVAGTTNSTNFPTTVGAYDRTKGGSDIFVSRFNPTGTQLTYSTFLGGDANDFVFDMVVGSDGAINLTGQTIIPSTGTRFPTTVGAADATTLGGDWEAFFTRLMPDGGGTADLRYSTYMGGDEYIEAGNGIAVDPADPTLVTLSGFTRSSDFPTTAGALLRVHPVPVDGSMGWVARFGTPASGASTLLWSTLYGASGNQTANDVVVDASGAAVIVGGTAVNNPPTTERAFDRIPANGVGTGDRADGYIAKISSDGSQLLYSTLLGASRGEAATEVVPAGGNSYVVAGITDSTDFPTTAGAFDTTYAFDGRPSGNDSPGTLAEDIYLTRINLDTPAVDTSPPPAPTISWPTEGSVFNVTSSDGVRVAYDWSDVTDPSGIRAYHVQVSPNAEFRNDLQAEFDDWYEPWSPTSFDSYFYCCSDSTNLTYSMRVQALDNAGNLGPWSPVRTYRLVSGSTSTTLTAPTLTSPPNNGRYAPGSITLAWNHVAGATSYRLEADTTTNFNSSNKITVANLTTNTRAVNLTGNRTWRWRVRAFNGTTAGPLSTVRSVQTQSGSPAAPTPPAGTPIPPSASSGTGLKSLVISPELAFGNQSVTGTVTLHAAAPAGGAVVDLVSQYPTRVIVPATVTVPAGQTTATFTGSAADGPTAVTATVMGTYGGSSQAWYVQANRGEQTLVLGSLALGSPTVQGGGQVTGTVTLSGIGFVPGPGGAVVHLGSTNPAVASVPPTVTIPQGANSATFTITTSGVASNTPVTIIATRSSMQTKILEVLPAGGLSGLSFDPTTAVGSGGSTGTVTLGGPAPAGGTVVALTSSDTRWVRVPATVTVPAGAASITFTAETTSDPAQGRFASVSASAGGVERFATLNVNPPPPGATLSAVSVNPSSVTGGSTSAGTVSLTGPAPSGGAVVTLTSSNSAVVSVPASVTVPAGSSSVQFTASTTSVAATTPVTITASRAGVNRTTTLTVNAVAAPATLTAVAMNPASLIGGASSTGTVTLSGAAPAGGLAVSLSSSNAVVASVPASLTVAAGATSATFSASTTAVTATTPVTITAVAGSVTRTAGLTLNPAGGGGSPLPAPSLSSPSSDARFNAGQTITFDWSDVAGAASYVLEIDDSESFTNPLVRSIPVTASTTPVSGLPTTRMWWRVRAVDASGNLGTASGSRRFELR